MTVPAEILSFTCGLCGDELPTTSLSSEIAMCRCGTTVLDHGSVQLNLTVRVDQ